jgi:hypothetical protein
MEDHPVAPLRVSSASGRLLTYALEGWIRHWRITFRCSWDSDPPVELLLQSSTHRLRKGLAKLLGACLWSNSWQHALCQLTSGCVYKNMSCYILLFTGMNSRQCRGSEMCFRCWWLCVSEATQRLGKINTQAEQFPVALTSRTVHVARFQGEAVFPKLICKMSTKTQGSNGHFFYIFETFPASHSRGHPKTFFWHLKSFLENGFQSWHWTLRIKHEASTIKSRKCKNMN